MTLILLRNQIRDWANRPEFTDELCDEFVRKAEHRINTELRCEYQINLKNSVTYDNFVNIPLDWMESDYIRIKGEKPLRYRERDDFFDRGEINNKGWYTVSGRSIIIGGPVDSINGVNIEMSYYSVLPSLLVAPNWLYSIHEHVYTSACLVFAFARVGNNEKMSMHDNAVSRFITTINNNHRVSRHSGSKLNVKYKGYK